MESKGGSAVTLRISDSKDLVMERRCAVAIEPPR